MDGKKKKEIPTAESIVNMLRSDPNYMVKYADRERKRDLHRREFAKASEPIISELAGVGINVASTEELRHSGIRYTTAIHVLVKWLPIVTNPSLKESIVRALSVPWAKPIAALPLITEFQRATGAGSDSLKWAIGNALSIIADDSVYNEIAEMVKDKRHGQAREMIAVALGNMKNPEAVHLLIDLLNDGDVAGHAIIALRKLNSRKAYSKIEKFLNDPKGWVRKEAEKTLAKLDGLSKTASEGS